MNTTSYVHPVSTGVRHILSPLCKPQRDLIMRNIQYV